MNVQDIITSSEINNKGYSIVEGLKTVFEKYTQKSNPLKPLFEIEFRFIPGVNIDIICNDIVSIFTKNYNTKDDTKNKLSNCLYKLDNNTKNDVLEKIIMITDRYYIKDKLLADGYSIDEIAVICTYYYSEERQASFVQLFASIANDYLNIFEELETSEEFIINLFHKENSFDTSDKVDIYNNSIEKTYSEFMRVISEMKKIDNKNDSLSNAERNFLKLIENDLNNIVIDDYFEQVINTHYLLRGISKQHLIHGLRHIKEEAYTDAGPPLIIGLEGAIRDIIKGLGIVVKKAGEGSGVEPYIRALPVTSSLRALLIRCVYGGEGNILRHCLDRNSDKNLDEKMHILITAYALAFLLYQINYSEK